MKTLATMAIAFAIATTAVPHTTHAQAVKITVDGVCGSGSIAGYDASGAYILTNAHVAGTRMGRIVNVDYQSDQGRRTVTARVITAAYSDSMLTDWAILKCEALKTGASWKISTTLPTEQQHQTSGSPRCVWPLQTQRITTRSITTNNTLWRWQPISIGGQSGSSVRDSKNITKGLLTWSWNGDGAGQTTSSIYRQYKDRVIEAAARPQGLKELSPNRTTTEEGFFTEANASSKATIAELPIWDIKTDPEPNCERSESEKQMIAELASRKIDYAELVKLILQLLDLLKR